jgi:hypothetical protein
LTIRISIFFEEQHDQVIEFSSSRFLQRSSGARTSPPIIVEPVKLGDEWHVLARHPSGQQEQVRRFKTESEAKNWIVRKSKAWLKKRGYADD